MPVASCYQLLCNLVARSCCACARELPTFKQVAVVADRRAEPTDRYQDECGYPIATWLQMCPEPATATGMNAGSKLLPVAVQPGCEVLLRVCARATYFQAGSSRCGSPCGADRPLPG